MRFLDHYFYQRKNVAHKKILKRNKNKIKTVIFKQIRYSHFSKYKKNLYS